MALPVYLLFPSVQVAHWLGSALLLFAVALPAVLPIDFSLWKTCSLIENNESTRHFLNCRNSLDVYLFPMTSLSLPSPLCLSAVFFRASICFFNLSISVLYVSDSARHSDSRLEDHCSNPSLHLFLGKWDNWRVRYCRYIALYKFKVKTQQTQWHTSPWGLMRHPLNYFREHCHDATSWSFDFPSSVPWLPVEDWERAMDWKNRDPLKLRLELAGGKIVLFQKVGGFCLVQQTVHLMQNVMGAQDLKQHTSSLYRWNIFFLKKWTLKVFVAPVSLTVKSYR